MLKHLPETALDTLLHIFNGIWTTGVFPESWRLATIIPIPKPGKDHAEPPWVLNFPPCRGPGGSIPTGNVASVVSSNCPLWEERRENTTRLPWVAARKPEEGILEVESYWEFGLS